MSQEIHLKIDEAELSNALGETNVNLMKLREMVSERKSLEMVKIWFWLDSAGSGRGLYYSKENKWLLERDGLFFDGGDADVENGMKNLELILRENPLHPQDVESNTRLSYARMLDLNLTLATDTISKLTQV